MRNIRILIFVVATLLPVAGFAQASRLTEDVRYGVSVTGTAGGGDNAPFWFTSNRYGLGATKNYTALGRAYIKRDVETDSLRFWQIGYGVDAAVGYGHESRVNIQQAFFDARYRWIGISLGQKERPSELKNPELSSGGLTLGMNARPIPQVRIEIPEFVPIPGTKGFLSVKAHIAYGWYTDNAFQEEFVGNTKTNYTKGSWFHSKALFIKIGNHKKFPLELTGGLEMACQFKGTGYNLYNYDGTYLGTKELGGNLWTALIPGSGNDVNDDNFSNAAGNHIGSWHLRLDWKAKKWSIGAYMEHLFEDQSQMFFQYGMWKDMLLGVEVNLPKNPFLSSVVYEHIGTMHQSGPIYHDATEANPLQISAKDSYYANHVYGSWQMGGFNIGSPLIPSPLYSGYLNGGNTLYQYYNRINAHHIGLKGNPSDQWAWRVLYTHEKNLGSYDKPTLDPLYGDFLLLETTYKPKWGKGIGFTASYGMNHGSLLGNANSGMLTVSFDSWIKKTN